MNKLILEVDVKVVTERVQKEIPLPLYLRIDENEYLHIDENSMCCYMYTDGDSQYTSPLPLIELYQYDYCLLEPSKRTYIDRWLKRYEDHICSKEEFEMFKKSLIDEL